MTQPQPPSRDPRRNSPVYTPATPGRQPAGLQGRIRSTPPPSSGQASTVDPHPPGVPRSTQIRIGRDGRAYRVRRPSRQRAGGFRTGCALIVLMTLCLVLMTATYAILPGRTTILLMGIDYAEPGSYSARTDTLMLTSFAPRKPFVSLLSIPRDLWVNIPGVGENRINTAHFYAESRQPGSGPQAVIQTIESNFGLPIDYYLRIRFEGFREVVDALGGVDINLDEPMAGYSAGRHHLTGRKALAFVRDRANADDFFRMSHGQLMLKSLFLNLFNPLKWPRFPLVADAFFKATDSNVPVYLWPRIILMLLLTGPNGVDFHLISREMVTPFTTDQGANILLPNWEQIHALIQQVFS